MGVITITTPAPERGYAKRSVSSAACAGRETTRGER